MNDAQTTGNENNRQASEQTALEHAEEQQPMGKGERNVRPHKLSQGCTGEQTIL